MSPEEIAVELKRFDAPDEVRAFAKGRLELVRFGSLVRIIELKEGVLFHVPPVPHDSACGDLP